MLMVAAKNGCVSMMWHVVGVAGEVGFLWTEHHQL
jgi:hypothetical protein